jgi:23S rRNA (guanosine2251-2'-O)-methyltransferase
MNDLIVGIHSIVEAIKNPGRKPFELYCTKESFEVLSQKGKLTRDQLEKIPKNIVSPHDLQEKAKIFCKKNDFLYKRITSNLFLVANPLPQYDLNYLFEKLKDGSKAKILCLDQVTDIQNAAAILRTAAFFGVDYVVVSFKGTFGMGPGFSRLSSGALEHIPIIRCASLPKAISSIKKNAVYIIGFSEHSTTTVEELLSKKLSPDTSICLVLGAEDKGLSSAVTRIVDDMVALIPSGPIKSLNVSVAAAIAMDRIFGQD